MMWDWVPLLAPWAVAATIGMLVGAADIMGRFKDDPIEALSSGPGLMFLSINAALALIALAVVRPEDPSAATAALAGLGASVVLRSKLFSVQAGDHNVSVGPAFVIERLLDSVIRSIDRRRARDRRIKVTEVAHGLNFAQARSSVLSDVFGAMQSLTTEERADLSDQAAQMDDFDVGDQDKLRLFCYMVSAVCGQRFLQEALEHARTLHNSGDGGEHPNTTV